jgi:hypothetical protein
VINTGPSTAESRTLACKIMLISSFKLVKSSNEANFAVTDEILRSMTVEKSSEPKLLKA